MVVLNAAHLVSIINLTTLYRLCEISSSHGGEYDVQSCLLGYTHSSLMMEAVRTSETSVDNHFTRQYNPEDSSEHCIDYISILTL
jgi:hypothetical protein